MPSKTTVSQKNMLAKDLFVARQLEKPLQKLVKQYPVITITGPRQSGKSTLCRKCFTQHQYCNLEDPDVRDHAHKDPRDFLHQHKYMIIDEVQKAPHLVSYIQEIVDKHRRKGQFILTGSQNFKLTQTVSQSLAGRTAMVQVLPFSFSELQKYKKFKFKSYDDLLWRGFYPRIVCENLNPSQALAFYVNTYVEKDLPALKEIKRRRAFEIFLRICAGYVGCIFEQQRISNDIGVDAKTIASWLAVLEASYIVYLLPPSVKSFKKRLLKRPKLYFYDVGLACYLLGLHDVRKLTHYHARGLLFENMVIIEKVKQYCNKVQEARLSFFLDRSGHEIDLIEERGLDTHAFEIKMAQTLSPGLFKGLQYYQKLNANVSTSTLIYTGPKSTKRYGCKCVPFKKM